MSSRLRQARTLEAYQEALVWSPFSLLDVPDGPKENVPPGAQPIALHRLGDGSDQAHRLHWGYKPPWHKRRSEHSARLDSVLNGSPLWRPLLNRRVIIPVDGWYEWTGDRRAPQPWYVSACDEAPIFLAGITAWEPGIEPTSNAAGFAVIVDPDAGGMVNAARGRRPVCLSSECALAWLDYTLTEDEALEVLGEARSQGEFHWWPVTPRVRSHTYQLPDATIPIEIPHQEC